MMNAHILQLTFLRIALAKDRTPARSAVQGFRYQVRVEVRRARNRLALSASQRRNEFAEVTFTPTDVFIAAS